VLKQKLAGKRVELSVVQIPNVFTIKDRGHLIVPIRGWDVFTIAPQKVALQVHYKILNTDNSEYKSGDITVEDANELVRHEILQRLKKMTWQYLGQYDAAINSMSKTFVDQLNKEM
jgi:hypothetical protein